MGIAERLYIAVMRSVEPPFTWLQKRVGIRGMAYAFVLPNLLVFGIFVALPMMLNVWYAVTGSNRLSLGERPFVGVENFRVLLDCKDYLDVNSCAQDRFWRAVHNTVLFVALQVAAMVLLSLLTALILNGRILARGFFRAVFFFPVLVWPGGVGVLL